MLKALCVNNNKLARLNFMKRTLYTPYAVYNFFSNVFCFIFLLELSKPLRVVRGRSKHAARCLILCFSLLILISFISCL